MMRASQRRPRAYLLAPGEAERERRGEDFGGRESGTHTLFRRMSRRWAEGVRAAPLG
jgi:hypothetical protein